MALALKMVTPPAANVVTLEEVKDQARITYSDHDRMLDMYILGAQDKAEALLNRKLITQTWKWFIDTFECETLRVPLSPLQSITHVKYYDTANVQQTISSADYEVDAAGIWPRLKPVSGKQWPSTYDRLQAVEIQIVVGYGASGAAVPTSIKHWILAAVTEAYNSPGLTVERQNIGESMSPYINGLLDPYTAHTF